MRSIERDAFTAATGYPPGLCIDGIELRDRVWLDRAVLASVHVILVVPERSTLSLDGVPGGFGGVGAPGRGGPPEGAVGELVDRPFRVLLEPVVVAAFGTGIA